MFSVRSKQINGSQIDGSLCGVLRATLSQRLRSSGSVCIAAILVAGLAGGCSTDVSRFDIPVFGAADNGGAAPPLPPPRGRSGVGAPSASISQPAPGFADDNVVRPAPRDGASMPSPMARGGSNASNGVSVANLPDEPVQAKIPQDVPPKRATARPSPAVGATAAVVPGGTASAGQAAGPARAGQTIDVAPGDTLYRLSSQHRVSISDLMAANNLQNPALKPGQKLIIPAATSVPMNRVPTRAEATAKANQQAQQSMRPAGEGASAAPVTAATIATPVGTAPVASVPAAAPGGNYTVQPGESFYGVARKHKVKAEELAQVNGITDVAKIKQGQVLKIPGPGVVAAAPATPAAAVNTAPGATAPLAPHAAAPHSAAPQGKIGAAGTKVAALGSTSPGTMVSAPATADKSAAVDPAETAAAAKGRAEPAKPHGATPASTQVSAPAVAAGGAASFRWPVKGKVITNFGPREDGTHNDGINISVPAGTDVQAAEGGTVAYAGNELKGYGNLVLIRHDENWVSAYAHNDQLLVKRGDKIKRGQIIAKAGKSGTVEQPQVHFELRQGSKPVDPMKHLASN
jgi:murein DD-endopeptidase MepM/ murein hydrolase activator NlpD